MCGRERWRALSMSSTTWQVYERLSEAIRNRMAGAPARYGAPFWTVTSLGRYTEPIHRAPW